MTKEIKVETTSFHPDFTPNIEKGAPKWLNNPASNLINQRPLIDYTAEYQFNKPDNYTNTRTARFQNLLQQELIVPLLANVGSDAKPLEAQQLAKQLLALISSSGLRHTWQQALLNRLQRRDYKINAKFKGASSLSIEGKFLKLHHQFECQGTATWINHDFDLEELSDPPKIVIASSPQKLFSGHSNFKIFLDENEQALSYQCIEAVGHLHTLEMRRPFIKATMDEVINQYLFENDQLDKNEHQLLQATKDYYINQIDANQYQQILLDATLYQHDFKESKIQQIITQVLKEKPLPGTLSS